MSGSELFIPMAELQQRLAKVLSVLAHDCEGLERALAPLLESVDREALLSGSDTLQRVDLVRQLASDAERAAQLMANLSGAKSVKRQDLVNVIKIERARSILLNDHISDPAHHGTTHIW